MEDSAGHSLLATDPKIVADVKAPGSSCSTAAVLVENVTFGLLCSLALGFARGPTRHNIIQHLGILSIHSIHPMLTIGSLEMYGTYLLSSDLNINHGCFEVLWLSICTVITYHKFVAHMWILPSTPDTMNTPEVRAIIASGRNAPDTAPM